MVESNFSSTSTFVCSICNSSMPMQNKILHEVHCKRKKEEEEKNSTVCIICSQSIKNSDYERHVQGHFASEAPPPPIKSEFVPCEICNQIIEFAKYEEHMISHRDRPKPRSISRTELVSSITGGLSIFRKHPGGIRPKHGISSQGPSSESQLPRLVYQGKGENKECEICLMEFQIGEKLIFLPCLHLFHEQCLLQWFKSKKLCPICKMKVLK